MKKLSVSFSGGRTSAYMARWLLDNKSKEYEFSFIFSNTGLEYERTLEFVNECDERWGLNLVWVEAVINPESGKGTRHKIVDFDTAHRGGDIFDDMCAAYGLPGPGGYTHCNRELKLHAMQSYYKSIGWDDYEKAVGLRADEFDRMNKNKDKLGIIYPLISMTYTTKADVIHWWKQQEFDLGLPEHFGNCVTCWKKSDRKLMTIAKHEQERFEHFAEFERKYCKTGAGATDNEHGRRFFFRNYQTVDDIIAKSGGDFEEWQDRMPEQNFNFIDELDRTLGCSESCDIYSE